MRFCALGSGRSRHDGRFRTAARMARPAAEMGCWARDRSSMPGRDRGRPGVGRVRADQPL